MHLFNLVFAFLWICSYAEKDPYKILGLKRGVTIEEVKKQYRKLARTVHPDRDSGNPDANKNFLELTTAYKKVVEDITGVKDSDDVDPGSDSTLKKFFHNFFDFGTSDDSPAESRGGDVYIDLFVTLEEIYNGRFLKLLRSKPVKRIARGKRKCNCRLQMKTVSLGQGRFQMIQEEVCDECPNVTFKTEELIIDVDVEPGINDGHTYIFPREGEPHIDGEPGDLHVVIKVLEHPVFKREGQDLHTIVNISLEDSLVGFNIDIPHLDGHKVTINRKNITKHGTVVVVDGEGLPSPGDYSHLGSLFVKFDVIYPEGELPDKLKEDLKTILRQVQ